MVLVKGIRNVSAFKTTFICCTNTHIQPCKALMPRLEPLTTNKYTMKDLFNFPTEIVDQAYKNFTGSLDNDSLITNIPFEEIIKICTNELCKHTDLFMVSKKVILKTSAVSYNTAKFDN